MTVAFEQAMGGWEERMAVRRGAAQGCSGIAPWLCQACKTSGWCTYVRLASVFQVLAGIWYSSRTKDSITHVSVHFWFSHGPWRVAHRILVSRVSCALRQEGLTMACAL